MKKFLFSIALLFVTMSAMFGQTVVHQHYVTHYNATKMEPDSVSWNLDPSMINCAYHYPRSAFQADPQIPGCVQPDAYVGSGFDRGHMFNAQDASCNLTDEMQCFYMSNMIPQPHGLNAGDWKTLEVQERVWAQNAAIRIIAGGYGSKRTIASGVLVPESCWKAIYVNGKWRGWVMPNDDSSKGHDYTYWEVKDISRFAQITGLPIK